ncbi:uncharacterized protein [Diadema setosum]|uniref:uncharacterized protein n=1 Tax=Diadema setosum TaxID=31175 RepID=UPI003B3A37C8
MSSSTLLREVAMDSFSSKFQTDFYRIVADKASTCQIQDLTVTTGYWNDNLQYHSSMGKDLARWVCTMPRLSTFRVKCHNLPNGFLSTAAEMAQFCQLYELSMVIDSGQISESEATAAAKFLCHIPHLRRARITCDNLPRTFFTTIDSQTSTLEKQDNHINNADRTGFPPMEPATTYGHSSVTEALVDHNADLKVSSESRRTYFYTSVRLDDDE